MEYGLHLKVDLMEAVGQTFLFSLPTTYQTSTAQHITSAELLLFSFSPFFLFCTSSFALNTWLYSFCYVLFLLFLSSLFTSPPDVGAGPEKSSCSLQFVSCKTSVDVKVMHNREGGKEPILHQIFSHFGWRNLKQRKVFWFDIAVFLKNTENTCLKDNQKTLFHQEHNLGLFYSAVQCVLDLSEDE